MFELIVIENQYALLSQYLLMMVEDWKVWKKFKKEKNVQSR